MKYPDFIEELLLAKEYSTLTETEKLQVGEWVTNEDEYTEIRELLLGIESAFGEAEEDKTPAHIQATLEQAFAKKYKAKRMLTIRWQAVAMITVAASLALIFYVSTLFTNNIKPTEVAENLPKKEQSLPKSKIDKPIESIKPKANKGKEEVVPALPAPPAIELVEETDLDEVKIVEEELNIVEDDIEANGDVARDVITEKKKQINLNEVVIVSPKEIQKLEVDKIQALPQRSYTSPSAPITMGTFDSKEITTSDRYYKIIGSASLAENKDVLDLGVPVF